MQQLLLSCCERINTKNEYNQKFYQNQPSGICARVLVRACLPCYTVCDLLMCEVMRRGTPAETTCKACSSESMHLRVGQRSRTLLLINCFSVAQMAN